MTASEKIRELIQNTKNIRTFPPVPEDVLHQAETQLGIVVPEEFRIFYTEISDGLWTGVKTWTDEDGQEEIRNIKGELLSVREILNQIRQPDLLCKEFPLEKSTVWGDDNLPHPERKWGNLLVANKDDEIQWHLIVNGESYGTMWAVCWAGALTAKKQLSFLDWLALWVKRPHGLENTKKFT